MSVNLLAIHTHLAALGGQPVGCMCPTSACGGSESGPGIPASGCTAAHGTITIRHHRAFDCPQLPADIDLSRLWLVVSIWTDDGPLLDHAVPFTRTRLQELRASSALWDVSEGDTLDDAVRAWQDRIDAMRAEGARLQAERDAEAAHRRALRDQSLAALRRSSVRLARRTIADPGDL
ncbi:hypothetical protein OHT59_40585 [Streptomyces sp. NBC_00243]|uniref:hypothetical protein n=1 Tax=Streptomyces sp. NBC_00243 TaxID=2975688 RepID=UPI002DD99D17|nr:hypothetical protein [Streptomyces sp. NBC_00243]WRZ24371.1 hypothetical protein OHT59_40585 [Streptomyces sp. NBC_00243]